MDQILYEKLVILREKIRNEGIKNRLKKNSTGVCSDQVLEAIVNLMPENLEEFKKIRGVGESFVEKYAQRFLGVVNNHIKTVYSYSRSTKKEKEILHKLSNKLVNINQKNRLLYTNRLSKKTGFDLNQLDDKKVAKIVTAFLNEDGSKQFVIAKASYDKGKSKAFEDFNAIKSLYREIDTVKTEKGQEILYLGYPYLEGKLFNDFRIKAPLLLFPAKIDVVNNEYRLSFDNTRDIVYNTTIILANNKFNNKNIVIPDDVLEDISGADYLSEAKKFFARYNVEIDDQLAEPFEVFHQTANANFPDYPDSKLFLKGYCVLGAFSDYSNSIQKDYNDIVGQKIISNLVRDLFVGVDDIDDNEIKYTENNQSDEDYQLEVPDESKLFYINELNYSQEQVLAEIEKHEAIVIQGPPGTGKSQTITSLVSQAVLQDKKVLVVSEKKTALDVIYNRLGKIANFVLYIDDPNNKESVYSQLGALLELDDVLGTNEDKIQGKSHEINVELNKLSDLEKLLDSETRLGASLRELYRNSRKLNLNDKDIEKLYKEVVSKNPNHFNLDDLVNCHKLLGNEELLNHLYVYKDYDKYKEIYVLFKTDIKETDLFLPEKDYYEIPFFIELYRKFGFITRFRLNNKYRELNRRIQNYCLRLGGKGKKLIRNALYHDAPFFMKAVEAYPKFNFTMNVYDSLKAGEREYFEYCYSLTRKLKIPFEKVNENLIDVITTIEIEEFENKYDNILITSERYPDIRDRIAQLSEEKEKLTFECLYNVLQENIKRVFSEQSKRLNELKRKCDSKRKWSISKLVQEFNTELFNSIYVWLLTPEGVSEILPLRETLFDLVIFDEASQMFIENAVPILYRGKKAVIAGDSKQLRPSKFGLGRIDSDDEDYDEYSGVLEEESLLDLAKHRFHEVMLNYHYRSHYEELIAFSNYAFYDGKLHICPNPVKTIEKPIERVKVNGRWSDRKNDVEADEVVTILKHIFSERKNNESIGVITFNATQKDLILDKIEQESLINPDFNSAYTSEKLRDASERLFVKNIENVQGDERDVIIFSVGYAPNDQNRIVRQFGWLNNDGGENRLNVAISRAKKKVYVVTSIEPFELSVEDLKNRGPKLLRNYLEYVKAVSENEAVTAQKILYSLTDNPAIEDVSEESPFADSVYENLVKNGLNVDRGIGAGIHKINFGVKNNEGEYTLGIELDDNKIPAVKERDYHRQKYLEGFSWKIHRIWASDWWRNPDQEIEKILKIINNPESTII